MAAMAIQQTLDGEDVPHGGEAEEASPTTADPRKLGYVGSLTKSSRDSDSWFTPQRYISAARDALGGHISLDPFSSPEANSVVKAERFLSESDNAFKTTWFPASREGETQTRTVWMNPPYGAGLVNDAIGIFLNEFASGSFDEGIVLVNNATETKWFQAAIKQASALTLTNHRIAFWNADGKAVSGNTRGQAFFYFGPRPETFVQRFSEFGFSCVLPSGSSPSDFSDDALPLDF